MSTTFSTSDGTRLSVREDGPADAPVTVVLLHGWTLTSAIWDRVVAGLPSAAAMPVRTVRFDLRGHGDSDPAPDGTATIQRCAEDLAELIAERVPTGPIVLVGHSMGGMTVQALAEQHPGLFEHRVAAVSLVATAGSELREPSFGLSAPLARVFNRGERVLRAGLGRSRRRRVGLPSTLGPGMRWLVFGARPRPSDVADSAEWVAAGHPASMSGFRWSLAAHDRLDALATLAKLEVPVVIMAGLADRLCPVEHARRMARRLPSARLVLYAGAGHMLPLERDDEVTDRIGEQVSAVARVAA